MGNLTWIRSQGKCKGERSYDWRYAQLIRKKKKKISNLGEESLYRDADCR